MGLFQETFDRIGRAVMSYAGDTAFLHAAASGAANVIIADREIDEEEVDQLDSGLDDEEDEMEPEAEDGEGSSSVKGRRKLGLRLPGHTLVPQDRLDNILQAEGTSGLSRSVVVPTNRCSLEVQDLTCRKRLCTCCPLLP